MGVTSKNCTKEETVNQQHGTAKYQLKCSVCYLSKTINNGHFTTVVKNDGNFICCDDLNITLTDNYFLLNTAYMVVYDRYESSNPAFINTFLFFFLEQ